MPAIGRGAWLEAVRNDPEPGDRWSLHGADGAELARYGWRELRFSVSWKAYCFVDEAERAAWRAHTDDLSYERVVRTLLDDLHARGRIDDPSVEHTRELGLLLIDEYVRFPGAGARAARYEVPRAGEA
jgi:hypothetical protein